MSNIQSVVKNLNSLHDFELINRAIDGDRGCFAEIVTRHKSTIATTAINMLGDIEEAKEIGQQVFIRFYKSMHTFKKESKLSTYLTRITINLCLNHLKRTKIMQSRSLELKVAVHQTSEHFSSDIENKELVNLTLQNLNEKHRAVLVLRMIKGYSTEETAQILDVPSGTVLSRLKRAMDHFKTILTNELKYEG